jgi:Transglycosylase SLT domain
MRPIPILALAIFVLGLKGAAADTIHADSLPIAGAYLFQASFEVNVPVDQPGHALIFAVPSKPADAAHDQGEQTTEPPRSPAPASADVHLEGDAPHSIADLCTALLTAAEANDLPVPFFANLIWQESGLKLDAVSPVGALGIAQFMPKTAAEVGLGDPFDPRQAIPASARFLHVLREQFGNLGFVAAAYNAGAHRVAEWLENGHTLPHETQNYVRRVTGRSIETWRKAPVDDSQLTFVRPLPCRQLPAFADLEQAQQRQAKQLEKTQQQAQQQQAQQQQEKTASRVTRAVTAKVAENAKALAPRAAQTARIRVAENIAQGTKEVVARSTRETEKKVPGTHGAAERKVVRSSAASKAAHDVRSGKREAPRHQHAMHERHKVA